MSVEELSIPGVLLLHPEEHADTRGWFRELLREEQVGVSFVQANHSHSLQGVLRGLHYHAKQSDAWYVASGHARVGLADLRTEAEKPPVLFVEMPAEEHQVLYIPPGVAHGFYAVTELDLIYWVTHYFDNTDEHGVRWDDPALGIEWGVGDPVLSERDISAPELNLAQVATTLSTAD